MLGCWSWSPWQQIQVGGTPTSDNVFFTSDIPGSSTACTAISFLCFSRRVAEFYSYAQKSQHVPHTSLTFKINIQYSITFLSRSFVRKGNPVMKIRKMTTDLRVSVLIQSFYKHVLKTGGGVQVEFYEAIESGSVVLATRLLEFVFFTINSPLQVYVVTFIFLISKSRGSKVLELFGICCREGPRAYDINTSFIIILQKSDTGHRMP